MVLFSIIIPMYNLENYIEHTLRSITKSIEALEPEICELILVDDGSKDNTVIIAENYLKTSGNFSYTILKKDNSGVSDARNLGMKKAGGEYLIFCDGDDFFEPTLLHEAQKAVDKSPDMAIWRYRITQGKRETVSQENVKEAWYSGPEMLHKHLLEGYRVRLGSFVVRRELIEQNEICFTSGCNYAEDMEFIMKCLMNAKTVHFIPQILFRYAKREGSLMYSYNITRFETPRTIKRVWEYALSDGRNTQIDDETLEYMECGLYALHAMYSFDACVQSADKTVQTREIYHEYLEKYKDVEETLCKIRKRIKRPPVGISKQKWELFIISRRWYLTIYRLRYKGC